MAVVTATLLFLVACGALQTFMWVRQGRWPRALLIAVFTVCYPMDMLAIQSSSEIYLTPTTFGSLGSEDALGVPTLVVASAWLTFTAFVTLWPQKVDDANYNWSSSTKPPRFLLYTLTTLTLTALIAREVLANGIAETLALRQTVFGSDPVTLVAYYALPPLIVLGICSLQRLGHIQKLVVTMVAALALAGVFLTGSRSGLILSCIVPIGLYAWRSASRSALGFGKDLLRLILIGGALAVAFFGGAWYITQFRGVTTSEGIFRSTDLSQADALVALTAQGFKPEWGATYLAGLTTLIPRSIWPDKPLPGNVLSSTILTPDRYQLTGAETTAGLLGEGYINFLWIGGVSAGVLLAFLALLCERLMRRGASDIIWVLGVLILLRGVNLIRGDLANVAAPTIITAIVWLLIVRRPGLDTPPFVVSTPNTSALSARSAQRLH